MNLRAAPLVAILVLFVAFHSNGAGEGRVHLNAAGLEFARDLITHGQFVSDKKGAWGGDHPTRSQENDFLRERGFAEYSKWFLATDEQHTANNKARYKFPFGNFHKIHRCGLLAIKARARQYGYEDIETAAGHLLQMIELARPLAKKRVD